VTRPTWGQALKDVAVKLAREAERFVGANDASTCAGCAHPRSEHCGCGMYCTARPHGSTAPCGCQGFAPKVEQAEG